MSGFEIAGVVLGAFPILCDTAKDLGTVFKKTKSWWQFETSFENFVSTIATQEIAYIQVLERLLDPLDITDGEYDGLLRNPRSTLWHEPHIQEELRHCLPQNKFPWFMWNLSELNTAIEGLQNLLPIGKARDCVYYMDSTNLESELYRLQTSFSSEKDRLLKRITDINDDLHQFFDRASTVTRPPAAKPTIPFRDLHNQAVTFYECLARCWKCCCSAAHTVGITTHPAIQKPPRAAERGYFNVLFEAKANPKQLRLQVETVTTVNCMVALDPAPAAPTIKIDAAIELKSQMLVKSHLKSASSAASENSISALALTSLSISGQARKAPQKSILKSAANKLRKLQHRKSADSTQGLKTSTEPASLSSLSTSSLSTSTTTLTSGASLKEPPKKNGLSRSRSSGSSTAVRFVDAETPPSSAQTDEGRNREVKSLCDFVMGADTPHGDKRNTLSFDEGRRVILEPEPLDQSTLKAATTQSIDHFLQTTKVRHSRLSVGLSFALTLLCLATSSWIPVQPSKDDVFLVCCESGGKMPQRLGPYFSRTSREICSSSPSDSTDSGRVWDAKASLLLLGVVLLELFHGQTLEQQASWAESLDDDGQPNESTRFCGAFLWVCRAEESLKEHFGRELGGALSEAIRKCICFDFGRDDDRGDLRLAEVVYKEVVVPLERCCPQM
ncbi:hypothetical protein CGRA01v4_08913 [Colletotrichum graminicola]|uniref:DUF7580 domain-containing protein n=1 Tax=Colletotrichum graminicola (strain M1.001 / M2 / FGSC 10212) TaxID=645133 RepID=E3Q7H9_COLGM|nr:uncharacterized protein GLRG_02637 [Colletotrichum graminicola M1.001]EFQ26817.1 hypothetical protein GLRG_02637 [Colletotrichum graminicola M1.001]WDK17629.1 hypothetical protein CGRA01v4_08913 [Colletotrichum graminicola]